MTRARRLALLLYGIGLAACSGREPTSAAERGRQVYLANCAACHATNPAQDGPLGPALKGSSQALLEARILHGSYPPGYTPKRASTVMQPMPQLAASLPDLSAYLR